MVSASIGSRERSSSTETTLPARWASSAVSGPMPGPISSTPQCSSASEDAAIRAGISGSIRKFCPMDLEKWKPWRSSSARMVNSSQRFMALPPLSEIPDIVRAENREWFSVYPVSGRIASQAGTGDRKAAESWNLCLYLIRNCGKVSVGYGMRCEGERLGAALNIDDETRLRGSPCSGLRGFQ